MKRGRVLRLPAVIGVVFFLGSPAVFAVADPVNSGVIADRNPFDPARRPWADIVPPPAPPAPISTEDIQLYGVVMAGDVRRAIVKVGGNLKHLVAPGGRAFLSVREGQSLGGYVVSEIQPQQLILSSGAIRQSVVFGKKTDRPQAPPMSPAPQAAIQVPTSAPPDSPSGGSNAAPAFPQSGSSPVAAPLAMPMGIAPPAASPAQASVPTPAIQEPAQANNAAIAKPATAPGQGMSLAEAIAAAQAAAAQGNLPPTPNPFQMRK